MWLVRWAVASLGEGCFVDVGGRMGGRVVWKRRGEVEVRQKYSDLLYFLYHVFHDWAAVRLSL